MRKSKGLATNIQSLSEFPAPEMVNAAGGPHRCHARACPELVPRRMLMCVRHWRLVPKALQSEVWRTYQTGQEEGKRAPSVEYLSATRQAIDAVATAEGRA